MKHAVISNGRDFPESDAGEKGKTSPSEPTQLAWKQLYAAQSFPGLLLKIHEVNTIHQARAAD